MPYGRVKWGSGLRVGTRTCPPLLQRVNMIFVSGPASVHGTVLHDEWKTIPVRGPRANFLADAIEASTASVAVVQEISGRSSVRLKQQEIKS
jgi:hypothetical protein